jgi:hypothetical protein
VLGEARAQARPLGRYQLLMAVAGVIAALGVITANGIASAYFGVALGVGEASGAGGALLVLAVNIVLLIVSGTATLFTQRWLVHRRR